MQFLKKYLSLLFITTLVVVLTSCQDSIPETIENDEVAQLQENTNLSNLLSRTSLKDGSKDNIIDRANNITVVLPITVIVNGIEINVTIENEYQLIENAIEAFPNDDDEVLIVFPIDIILSDFTPVTVLNQTEFNNYVSESTGENELDEDIECIDFMYPITFEAIKVNGTIPTTIVITNDDELFELIDNLDVYASINFNFPITLITFDDIEIIATDLDSLESTLENNIDTCDEDDDFDFNDDDEAVLISFLTNGNWIIDEYVFADVGFTVDYLGYVFTFTNTMAVNAVNGGSNVSGSWTIVNTDPNNLLIVLDFGTVALFDVLSENWKITEIEVNRLALEIGSELAGDLKILVFEKL
jgi:hypothetical protein